MGKSHSLGFRGTIRLVFLLAFLGLFVFLGFKLVPIFQQTGSLSGVFTYLISGGAQWKTETLYEYFTDKNEWVVYSYEKAGTDTVSRDVALLGTVQKVQYDYTFTMGFKVDMSQAQFQREGEKLTVRIPSPYADNGVLTIDEESIKQYSLFVFSGDKVSGYEEMREFKRNQYFETFAQDEQVIGEAWDNTVRLLEELVSQITQDSQLQVTVIRDDTLGKTETAE